MGNFEKLSVLVIVVIIVMILVVAIYTWTDNPDQSATTATGGGGAIVQGGNGGGTFEPGPMPREKPEDHWKRIFEPKGLDEDPDANPKKGQDEPPKPAPEKTKPVTPEPDRAPKPEPAAGEPWMYTVKSGDTLSEIAMRELGTWRLQKEIIRLNAGLDPSRLRVGQQLKMPAKGLVGPKPTKVDGDQPTPAAGSGRPVPGEFYVTRAGDTLERISKMAYKTVEFWPEIWSRNLSTLNAPGDIRPGLKLFIPPKP